MLKITNIKQAITKDGTNVLKLDKHLENAQHWPSVCYRVDLLENGRLIGCEAFNTYPEAQEAYYRLVEDGMRFNHMEFEVLEHNYKEGA